MGKFKTKPTSPKKAPDPTAVAQFAAGAKTHSFGPVPGEGLDPQAKPTSGINLRLNDYELSLLRYLAQAKDRSIQKTIKRLLLPALEGEIDRLVKGKGD